MEPTLLKGDLILTKIKNKKPEPNEIWVFRYRGNAIVKRISKASDLGFWVEGDNKSKALDSRHFGWVTEKNFEAQVRLVLFNKREFSRFIKAPK